MIIPKGVNSCKSELFSGFSEINQAFCGRVYGDIRKGENLVNLKNLLEIGDREIIYLTQNHTKKVFKIKAGLPFNCGQEGDGLIYKKDKNYSGPVLLIKTADCLPIFIYDQRSMLIGACHAGWQGILAGIVEKTIEKMKISNTDNVYAAIGPRICGSCYTADEKRAKKFIDRFGINNEIVFKKDAGFRIDLTLAALSILDKYGIKNQNIDSQAPCTRCNINDFFSYRGDTKITYGVQANMLWFV